MACENEGRRLDARPVITVSGTGKRALKKEGVFVVVVGCLPTSGATRRRFSGFDDEIVNILFFSVPARSIREYDTVFFSFLGKMRRPSVESAVRVEQ